VRDLVSGPRRFVELQRTLPGISTEQLRSRLNRMVADGLLTRQRYREVPPRVDYELTERSRDLVGVLGALARWGYAWAWSSPREGEEVNVGAVLRLAPGLLTPPANLEGTVELVVGDDDNEDGLRSYLLSARGGRVEVSEAPPVRADARVRGTVDAWVAALGPDGDQSGLRFSGSRRLAEQLLGGLAGFSRPDAVVA